MDDLLPSAVPASRFFAGFSGAIAAAVLVFGWIGGFDAPKRLSPDFAAMAPSTSVCFLLMAAAVFGLEGKSSPSTTIARASGGLVIALAVTDLIISALTTYAGLDALLLFRDNDHARMAVATAVSFLLAGSAALALAGSVPQGRVAEIAATTGLFAAAVALAGYLFDSQALYGVFLFTAMALHTALAFLCLFVGLLLVRPDGTWVGVLLADAPGSHTARRLLPLIALSALGLCLATFYLVGSGAFGPNFGFSLLAISMILLAAVSLLWGAADVNGADRRLRGTLDELRIANDDKALLLREVYHRVKNNLQQISAMLAIESRKLPDPLAREGYEAIVDRVRTMGLVHQLLISSDRPSAISMAEFLPNLIDGIAASHDLKARGINLVLDVASIPLKIDAAIPVGLLTNEIVTNAIKHAFPNGRAGRIEVSLREIGGDIRLAVEDNGAGPPGGAGEPGTGTLIVRSMVSQLEGTMSQTASSGTRVEVTFPADINERGTYQ